LSSVSICVNYHNFSLSGTIRRQEKGDPSAPAARAAIKLRYIVMDYLPYEELYHLISRNGKMEHSKAKKLTNKLLAGLDEMHNECGLAHLDVKLENIMVDPATGSPYLVDFGFVRKISKPQKRVLGTSCYMAPEVFQKEGYCPQKADIFSVGVVLFMLLYGQPPFHKAGMLDSKYKYFALGKGDLFFKISPGTKDDYANMDKDLVDVFMRVFSYKPEERPLVKELRGMPWLTKETV